MGLVGQTAFILLAFSKERREDPAQGRATLLQHVWRTALVLVGWCMPSLHGSLHRCKELFASFATACVGSAHAPLAHEEFKIVQKVTRSPIAVGMLQWSTSMCWFKFPASCNELCFPHSHPSGQEERSVHHFASTITLQ